jgi:hypothetical protein
MAETGGEVDLHTADATSLQNGGEAARPEATSGPRANAGRTWQVLTVSRGSVATLYHDLLKEQFVVRLRV